MSRPSSLANQHAAEHLKSIKGSHYSPRKATLAVHVTTRHVTKESSGLAASQPRSRAHEKNDVEVNNQQPQEPFYAHETWSSAAVIARRPRDDDKRTNPLLDHLRKQQQYANAVHASRGDRARRRRSDQASMASSRKEVRFKLASVTEDDESEPKPDERLRRTKTAPSKMETINGKSEHTKSENVKLEHSKSENTKSEHSKSEHSKSEHSESPRKKKSKHPKEASASEPFSSPSKSFAASGYTLPEITPLEPLYMPSLQPEEYDTPPFMVGLRVAPIHSRLTKAVPMEPIYNRMPVLPPQYAPSAASFPFHSVQGRRRQVGVGGAPDEFVPIYRRQPDHRTYVAFGSEPAPGARFNDTYHWRDNMTYVMGQQSFYAGAGRP